MNTTLKNSALAWALIFAQLFVITLSQGRMVVCHQANGSSHIELVNDILSDLSGIDSAEHQFSISQNSAFSSCSDGPCVDELFTAAITVIRPRLIELGNTQGLVGPPLRLLLWDDATFPFTPDVVASTDIDAVLLNNLHARIGSTVLLL